jgi:peptidoglycan hydrolase-like protein with peptidoglycan-binding domain
MIGRFARFALRRPATLFAVLGALGVWGMVAVNAVALQDGAHPAPLLGYADEAARQHAVPRPAPASLTGASDPEAEAERRRAAEEDVALLRDLQELLTERGFYSGEIDGLRGPMTSDAIRAWQQTAGLEPTGEPTVALLAQIQLSSYVSPPVPEANPLREASASQEPGERAQPEANAPGLPSMSTLSGEDVALVSPEPDFLPDEPVRDPRVEALQSVLADLGYAPGRIDGEMGPQTEEAIRRFEADRGMSPTGDVSERLLRELSAVSGIPLGVQD